MTLESCCRLQEGDQQANNQRKKRSYFDKRGDDKHGGLQPSGSFRLTSHSFHSRTTNAADTDTSADDPWDAELDAAVAREVLAELGAHHRAALTLRYLDGLSVPEVARELDRTVHATEALLVRARRAFRSAYEERGNDG